MKRLWKYIPPCLSDVLGFQAIMSCVDGLGVIDDSSRYKSLPGSRDGRIGHDERGSRGEKAGRGAIGGHGHGHHGDGGRHREREKSYDMGRSKRIEGRGGEATHVIHSDIRTEDIISGTDKKILAAAREALDDGKCAITLFAHAPSASMIGSDLEGAAERIAAEKDVPAEALPIDGSRDYIYGMSVTLEALGRMLLKTMPMKNGCVNILGDDTVDMTNNDRQALEELLTQKGYTVLSHWGSCETADHMRQAASAEKNLVVSAAGMRLAHFMEQEYGIPYDAKAPYGSCSQSEETSVNSPLDPADEEKTAVILGEQFKGNAIRNVLRNRGYSSVCVLSFYEMDKNVMAPGDKKLTGEDDLKAFLEEKKPAVFLAAEAAHELAPCDTRCITLPDPGAMYALRSEREDFFGDRLDDWLDKMLG